MLAATLSCLQALAPVPAGGVAVRADFVAVPCPDTPPRVLRYDPGSRAARAVRDIASGETLADVPAAMLADVRPGEALFLVARVGRATVEREVSAVQAGRRGQRVFVRTGDGRVISVTLAEDGE